MITNEIDLFRGIDFAVMEQINGICVEEFFKAGTTLFKRGEDAEVLYILEDGTLKLEVENGSSLTFRLTEPGSLFGWSSLAETGKYTASGISATDLKAVKIHKRQLEKIFKQHPDAGLKIMRRMVDVFSSRLSNAYQAYLDLLSFQDSQPIASYG
ncbi:MAG: cyclic nucleotide-binding domain-containing protein [Desulfobacteraceae bacterium]|nr:cyclic nucleotide-binding domain-containing protein [Desulfobacteraceae bacterium]